MAPQYIERTSPNILHKAKGKKHWYIKDKHSRTSLLLEHNLFVLVFESCFFFVQKHIRFFNLTMFVFLFLSHRNVLRRYSKICLKRSPNKKTKSSFRNQLSLNAGQKYFSTVIKLPFVFKIFVSVFLSGRLRYVALYINWTLS